jgi:hypothetical protein
MWGWAIIKAEVLEEKETGARSRGVCSGYRLSSAHVAQLGP